MIKTKNCEVFYPRNFISLLIISCFVKYNKSKNFKILFLNKQYFSIENIIFFKSFFLNYFDQIKTIDFRRRKYYRQKTTYEYINARSDDVKKFIKKIKLDLNKIKIMKIFNGGDDFNFVIYKLFQGIFPTYYIEHGIGNLRDSLSDISKITYKKKIKNFIAKLFFKLKIFSYYPIKYNGYVSVFSNRFKKKFRWNNYYINNVNINKKKFSLFLDELISYIQKKKKLTIKTKSSVLIHVDELRFSKNKKSDQNILMKVLSLTNKNENIILKDHPKNKLNLIQNKDFRKELLIKLKKRRQRVFIIQNKFLRDLPAELIIKLFRVKKIISSFSTTPFLSKIINDKINTYVLFKYSIDNIKDFEDNLFRLKNVEKRFRTTFKDINFI